MTPSRVAVVVTCYNLGRTLGEAVDSVRAQSPPAAELLVVDDGSDDLFTRQALVREGDAGCRIVRTPNRGVAAARNVGVALTSAEYLVMLDADDRLEPEYLATLSRYLDEHRDIGFVSCAMRSFGAAAGTWVPPEPSIVNGIAFGALPASSMFRRELWERVGGFDGQLDAYEDLDFWTTALELGFRGAVVPEPLFHYRVRPGSRVHRGWQRGTHERVMRCFFAKHERSVAAHWEELLLAKEEFILQQRAHETHLDGERRRLERELAGVHEALAAEVAELASLGGSRVEMGDLRRVAPVSASWGLDRGRPIDRYYIEAFLDVHRADIRGRVLEVKDDGYARVFGGDRVQHADVLDVDPLNEEATVVAYLSCAESLPSDTYDAFVLTQTLGLIEDVRSAVGHACRVLKPGGVLLCTLPAAGRLSCEDRGVDGDYWRFTEASVRAIFARAFPLDSFEVRGFGNVLSTSAFLYGLADHELRGDELDPVDPSFPLVYAVRAVKPARAPDTTGPSGPAIVEHAPSGAGLVLLYHRLSEGPDAGDRLSIPLDAFRAQMELLRERCEVRTLKDLARAAMDGTLRGRVVAVTFDDAYAETASLAVATLGPLGLPATIFATSEGWDVAREFWWDRLERVLEGPDPVPPELSFQAGGLSLSLPTGSDTQRREASLQLRERLHRAAPACCDAVLDAVEAWAGARHPPRHSRRPCDRGGLARLASTPGITIGGHATRHAALSLLDEESRRIEIAGNKHGLEDAIGRRVAAFAYPYGAWDGPTVRAVREAGYDTAVTVDEALVRNGTPALLVPRYDAPPVADPEAFLAWIDERFRG